LLTQKVVAFKKDLISPHPLFSEFIKVIKNKK